MFPPNKKPAMGGGSMFGKKPAMDDLSGPDSPDPSSRERDAEREPEREVEESPAMEMGENYGAQLLSDMTKPLMDAGMDEAGARETLAAQFEAAAACLRGGSGGGDEQIDVEGEADRYGR